MAAKFAFQLEWPVTFLPPLFVHQVSTPFAPSPAPFGGKIGKLELAAGALQLFYHVPKSIIDIVAGSHSPRMPRKSAKPQTFLEP